MLRAFRERYGIRPTIAELSLRGERSELRKTLGAWQLAALGVGAIVGVGVFTVIGVVASDYTGPAIAISFLIAAAVSALIALVYAELATLVPLGGSAYTYATTAMGELVGWIVAWSLILSYAIGNSAVASGFSDNLSGLFGSAGLGLSERWTTAPELGGAMDVPALLVVLLVTVLLLRPVKESATTNLVLVVIKVGTLLLFLALGATAIEPANYTPFATHGWAGILAGTGLSFAVFLGFDAVSTAAEETKNPKRDLPLGILGSLLVVTVLYVAVSLVLTGMVPSASLESGEPLAFALREAGYGWAGAVLNVGGILATLSVLLVFQLATTRIVLAIARDGLLPGWLGEVNARYGTPNRVTLALGLLVGVGAALLPLNFLIALTTEATLFFFAIVCLAVPILRKLEPHAPRAFRCPWNPWIPIAGAVASAYFMTTFEPEVHLGFVAWTGLGLMVYGAYGASRSRLRAEREAKKLEAPPIRIEA